MATPLDLANERLHQLRQQLRDGVISEQTYLMSVPLNCGRFRFALAPKQTDEEKQKVRDSWREFYEKQSVLGICRLFIKLDKSAQQREAQRRRELQRGPERPKTVRHYPTLGLAAMQAYLTAAFRLWLILQALDDAGRGCHDISDIYRLLTGKRSRWRIYKSKRAIRHIMAQGEGIFWDRHTDGRLWTRSPDRVADALGCGRLAGMPVLLPVYPMLGKIGKVRAHLFAAYESGRRSDAPISRAALAETTGIPERTQRDYSQRLKLKATPNIVITGLEYNQANKQEMAGHLMRPVFSFCDWVGKRGPAGALYVAYRIADTRQRCHKQAAKGRIRKINRNIDIDLVDKLARGKYGNLVNREYHANAEKAGKAVNRNPDIDHYYLEAGGLQPNAKRKSKREGVKTWGVVLSL
jgi:hypothetical protein